MANIGAIVGGAFRVIRERPGAVVVWGVVWLIGVILLALLIGLLGGALGAGAPGMGGYQRGGGFYIAILLFYLGLFLLMAILMNAVFRTVLRPEQWRFFSLRLGMDEWRMFGLILLVVVCSVVIGFVVQLLLTLLALVVRMAAGDNELVAGIGGIILLLAYLSGLIWVSVRISLMYPLTFYRRAMTLDEAWSLTRGRFWPLFAAYLVIAVLLIVVFGSLIWFSFRDVFAAMALPDTDPYSKQLAVRAAYEQMAAVPLAIRLLVGVAWLVATVIGSVLWFGMIASATRELLLEEGEVLGEDAESTAAIFE